MISVQDISFHYPNHDALFSGVTFTVSRGEAVAIVGPNGSGKTTLLRILAGAMSPSSGKLSISEMGRVILVPTNMDHFLLPWYSVERNLAFFNHRRTMQPSARGDDYRALIGAFFPTLARGGLSREVYKLSSGEKAIVGYACAMEARPDLLILDELFGNLSLTLLSELMNHIRSHLTSGLSVVFTSHAPEVVRTLARKTIALIGRLAIAMLSLAWHVSPAFGGCFPASIRHMCHPRSM